MAEITAHIHLRDVVGMLADLHVGTVDQDLWQRLQHMYIFQDVVGMIQEKF